MTEDSFATKAPPTVTPKAAYHHGNLRAQLIMAVRELVEAHGADRFSVAEAARRAGVSSAAPYKHFKDRHEILRGVVSEAMDRLHAAMEAGAASHPPGALESVAAAGLAYVGFAQAEPGVFRLAFALTEGPEEAPDLVAGGEACFGVVLRCAAACLGRPIDDPDVQRRAYLLWSFVHGHSFLTINTRLNVASAEMDDWGYLMTVSRTVLVRTAQG